MLLLYTASTLHHALRLSPVYARRLQRLDHAMIYVLIAGTYTPVCLILLRGAWGWSLFGVEAALAAVGVSFSIFWNRVPDWLRVVLYLSMGWLIVVAFAPLRHVLTPSVCGWMIAGGVTYSIGTIIFAADRPHLIPGKFHAHDLWHCFVLAGSVCHFLMILLIL